jgi:hypothetical protein
MHRVARGLGDGPSGGGRRSLLSPSPLFKTLAEYSRGFSVFLNGTRNSPHRVV